MILLSKIIKSNFANTPRQGRVIIPHQLAVSFHHGKKSADKNVTEFPAVQHQAQKIIADAEQQANAIIQNARLELQQIQIQIEEDQNRWQYEKEQLIQLAKEEGYQTGYQQGKEEAYQKYQSLIQEAQKIVDAAKKDYEDHIHSSESTILMIAMKVAERIIGTKLQENNELFGSLVKRAIKEIREHSDIVIRTHPKFYDVVLSQKKEILSLLQKEKDIYVIPDDELEENSCIIDSSFGRIDASVDSQLSEIKEKLLELLGEA
jgi:flagellar assembly protein FliH